VETSCGHTIRTARGAPVKNACLKLESMSSFSRQNIQNPNVQTEQHQKLTSCMYYLTKSAHCCLLPMVTFLVFVGPVFKLGDGDINGRLSARPPDDVSQMPRESDKEIFVSNKIPVYTSGKTHLTLAPIWLPHWPACR